LSVVVAVCTAISLVVMERVGVSEVGELLKEVERPPPLSGFRYTGYAECICAADVADDGFMVGECNDMAGKDNVMYAYEGCAVSVGYHRERVGSDVGCLFDRFRLHVAVPDGGSWWGGADV
jgi:hypothetical protein